MRIRRAVVLAAGKGSRLTASVDGVPKPAVPLHGRPLVAYTLAALAAAGLESAVVVVGHAAELVRRAIGYTTRLPTTYLHNPRFEGPAGLSLAVAREACGSEQFVLVMADHVLSPELVTALLTQASFAPPGASVVAADFHPRSAAYVAEATKLRVAPTPPGTPLLPVTAIGKDVAPSDALDAGAFVCSPTIWDVLSEVGESVELNVLFQAVAERGQLYAADISGCFWYDIDTAEDLAAAAQLLANSRLTAFGSATG